MLSLQGLFVPLVLSCLIFIPSAAAQDTFALTGSMGVERKFHTATLLPNGKVLITGGLRESGQTTNSATLYDLNDGFFTPTGPMGVARQQHTATLLNNGKVLIAGGLTTGSVILDSTELFDPAGNGGVGSFSAAATMTRTRYEHSAVALPDGKVLIVAGFGPGFNLTNTAELYNPVANSFGAVGNMMVPRWDHTATLLANNKVLFTGGVVTGALLTNSAELYDIALQTFGPSVLLMGDSRIRHTATRLGNGRVLIAGGITFTPSGNVITNSAEIFDPVIGAFKPTANLATGRHSHTATLLNNGKVLLASGVGLNVGSNNPSAELYDAGAGTFGPAGNLAVSHSEHTATLLADGQVLIAGGVAGGSTTDIAQLFTPNSTAVTCPANSLQAAIDAAAPGATLTVSGTCSENILIRNEKQRITINGLGAASINAPNANSPAVNIRGKGILWQGFLIGGGSSGIHVNRGSNAVIHNNLIQSTAGHGVLVEQLAFAVLTNNTIQNNPDAGILVGENSTARIGFNQDSDTAASANVVVNNAVGAIVANGSSARIVGNTIQNNAGDGIQILRDSHADIASNAISGNSDGIEVGENSFVQLGEDSGTSIYEAVNTTTSTNTGFGIKCTNGGSADGRQGTLTGTSGPANFDGSCIDSLMP